VKPLLAQITHRNQAVHLRCPSLSAGELQEPSAFRRGFEQRTARSCRIACSLPRCKHQLPSSSGRATPPNGSGLTDLGFSCKRRAIHTRSWPLRLVLCGNGDRGMENRNFGIAKTNLELSTCQRYFLVWIENPTEFVISHVRRVGGVKVWAFFLASRVSLKATKKCVLLIRLVCARDLI